MMKTKIITNTYLRAAEKYEIKLFLNDNDYYISVKKLIKISEKFIIETGICVMDDNYYIFEVIPKNENYAMRLFLDVNKIPLEYYFDICKNCRLDEQTKIPCYDDLYLDITYQPHDGYMRILDENELIEAYDENDITEEEFKLVYKVKDKLLEEIKTKTNKLMNIDYNKYLDNF